MSELNELIATSASHAYHAGELHERDRIVKILQEHAPMIWREGIIKLIKGEHK